VASDVAIVTGAARSQVSIADVRSDTGLRVVTMISVCSGFSAEAETTSASSMQEIYAGWSTVQSSIASGGFMTQSNSATVGGGVTADAMYDPVCTNNCPEGSDPFAEPTLATWIILVILAVIAVIVIIAILLISKFCPIPCLCKGRSQVQGKANTNTANKPVAELAVVPSAHAYHQQMYSVPVSPMPPQQQQQYGYQQQQHHYQGQQYHPQQQLQQLHMYPHPPQEQFEHPYEHNNQPRAPSQQHQQHSQAYEAQPQPPQDESDADSDVDAQLAFRVTYDDPSPPPVSPSALPPRVPARFGLPTRPGVPAPAPVPPPARPSRSLPAIPAATPTHSENDGATSAQKMPPPAYAPAPPPLPPLPPHWVECQTGDNRTYYWNTKTQETSWTLPAA
jgi:hypothetical protein